MVGIQNKKLLNVTMQHNDNLLTAHRPTRNKIYESLLVSTLQNSVSFEQPQHRTITTRLSTISIVCPVFVCVAILQIPTRYSRDKERARLRLRPRE